MPARSLLAPALLLATAVAGLWNAPAPAALVPPSVAQEVIEAESATYTVDGAHSTSFFGIRHLGVANFYGRFNSTSGEVVLDMEKAENCSIKVSIDPGSIDTASKGRDDHVLGPDFLDVANHPLMGFQSTAIRGGERGVWEVSGQLTLHGVSKEIQFEARLVGAGKTAFGDYRIGLEASFAIQRSDYGMDVMLDKLGDEIRFTLSLEGIRQG